MPQNHPLEFVKIVSNYYDDSNLTMPPLAFGKTGRIVHRTVAARERERQRSNCWRPAARTEESSRFHGVHLYLRPHPRKHRQCRACGRCPRDAKAGTIAHQVGPWMNVNCRLIVNGAASNTTPPPTGSSKCFVSDERRVRVTPRSIMLLTSSLQLGGAERQLVELALGLQRSGWSVTAVASVAGGDFRHELARLRPGFLRQQAETLGQHLLPVATAEAHRDPGPSGRLRLQP